MSQPTPENGSLPILGWRERVDLPEWGVSRILTKVDTGAMTSSIHVEHLEQVGEDRVRFEVVVARATQRRAEQTISVETDLVRTAKVRPSTGKLQRRPVVSTLVRIGPIEHRVELSLVSRDKMLCRMLLGRAALTGLALVDPGQTYLLSAARPSTRKARR
jgi:hypothetical protein